VTKIDWIKFEHQRFLLMTRRESHMDVANNIRSRRFCIPGFLPSTLRAVLRTFKIAPGDFVEPAGLTNKPSNDRH